MVTNKSVLLTLLVAASCVDGSWLPWKLGLLGSGLDLKTAPNNDLNIHHSNASTICLRLSTSMSILVQYEAAGVRDGVIQVVVPHLTNENVEGSCGPDAFMHLSWPSDEATKDSTMPEEINTLNVEETPWFERTTFADANTNSLHFDFVLQDDKYFLSNISGFIILNDTSDDYSPDSTVAELSIGDQRLFEAPLGVVSMCYGETLLEGEAHGNVTAISLFLNDVQLLAYHEESFWPNEATWCRSAPVVEPDDTVAIVLGTLAAVVGVALLGAFIYYLRSR